MNFPYNYSYEVHRFAEATRTAATPTRETFLVPRAATSERIHEEDNDDDEAHAPGKECPQVPHPVLDPASRDVHAGREAWSKDHADIVVFMHALKVELTVQHIMRLVVHETDHEPFQYWLRFEFGTNTGNPHAHGMAYAAGNPHFDSVVADEDTRQRLLSAKKHIEDLTTWSEAETKLADYYSHYVREMHPAKEPDGTPLYDFVIENLMLPSAQRPQTVNLREVLERAFSKPDAPDLSELQTLLLALIEDGQRHTWHGHRTPTWGKDPCARKIRKQGESEYVICRYLFPRDLVINSDEHFGVVRADPHRQHLLNLFLRRNDSPLNNCEEHLLVMNLGMFVWHPLINLWSVLEYLSKYTAKVGKATQHLGKLFGNVVETVCSFESEDGIHDLWRRTIMKFYSKLIGNRDYSLFEVAHFGLRLPGVLSSFGPVESITVSNWASLKRGKAFQSTKPDARVTHLNKLELFDNRQFLKRSSQIADSDLENISFYCFWRLFSVTGNQLRKRRQEKMLRVNGCGWPRQAKTSHPQHSEYARKTFYAYAPCHGLRGSDYLDDAVRRYHGGDWAQALRAFVQDHGNQWCPTWIKRNYEVENPETPDTLGAQRLQERLQGKAVSFQFPVEEEIDEAMRTP